MTVRGDASVECGLGYACSFCPQESLCDLDKPAHNKRLIEARLERFDQIVMVLANKGGVGKSTVSANLAVALARRGYRVGLADADIHGPNALRFFGRPGARSRLADEGLSVLPFGDAAIKHSIRVASLGGLIESQDTPIVWRDAYKHDFVHHLAGSFDWGDLDFWIIDMPPGTGNELITLTDLLEGTNLSALLVTTPQAVALMDTLKAARFCRERGLPLLGAVENMAGIDCPHCGGSFHLFPRRTLDASLEAAGLATLARVPMSAALAEASDDGAPVALSDPHGREAMAFDAIAHTCIARGRADMAASVAHGLPSVFQENLKSDELRSVLDRLPADTASGVRDEIEALLEAETNRLAQSATREGAGSGILSDIDR